MGVPKGYDRFIDLVRAALEGQRRLPTKAEMEIITHVAGRSQLIIDFWGWGTPCHEAMELVKKYANQVVEIGAGTGFFSHVLRTYYGVDARPTDIISPKGSRWFPKGQAYHIWAEIEELNAFQATMRLYKDRAVLVCWPSNQIPIPGTNGKVEEPFAEKVLKQLQPGRLFFYLGDPNFNLTGSQQMKDILETDYHLLDEAKMPGWTVEFAHPVVTFSTHFPFVRVVVRPAKRTEEVFQVYRRKQA